MVYATDGTTRRQLDTGGLLAMADVLSDAFMDHYNWKRVLTDEQGRKRALFHLFAFLGSVVNEYGHIVVTTEHGEPVGYTTFMENCDHSQVTPARILKAGALPHLLCFLAALGPRSFGGVASFNAAIARFYRTYASDPQGLHLYNTGIMPAFRGKGLMKRSFLFAESQFKSAGFTSYFLETTDPGNIPIYERFGMRRFAEVPMPRSDRLVYFFERRFS
jgi:GNAT superfamily N-acetyltransferase